MRVWHPVQAVVPVEVEGMNDSAEESVLLHVLVRDLADLLIVDRPLLANLRVYHPLVGAQVIESQ